MKACEVVLKVPFLIAVADAQDAVLIPVNAIVESGVDPIVLYKSLTNVVFADATAMLVHPVEEVAGAAPSDPTKTTTISPC